MWKHNIDVVDFILKEIPGFYQWVSFQFEELKRNLLRAKEELEYAQEDQKKSDTPGRKKATKKAQEKYEKELKAVRVYPTSHNLWIQSKNLTQNDIKEINLYSNKN